MKKQLLSAAVLLGLAGGATAVNLNENGLGQVLLYPYYNIAGGKDSYFSVVNTTGDYKAVKVRVNEGANTWEVLDYNVYLSPYDVYTFTLTMKGDQPSLTSFDTTCTVPNDPERFKSGVALKPNNIDAFHDNEPEDFEGLDTTKRMMEGHIEIIEMGRVTDGDLQDGIVHKSGTPVDCSLIENHVTSSTQTSGLIPLSSSGINGQNEAPTGGLFGDGIIIDVANGSMYSYEATAINNFYNSAVHTQSGESYPNVAGLSDAGKVSAQTTAQILRDGSIIELDFDEPIQALGAVLMADKIYNTFDVYEGTLSATDWIITFPTKHAHVNPDTTTSGLAAGQYGVLDKALEMNAESKPFNGFCNDISLIGTDREEDRATSKSKFSPSSSPSQQLCYETNVINFDDSRTVVDSILANNAGMKSSWPTGWAALSFKNASLEANSALIINNDIDINTTTDNFTLYGLPVLGFAMSEARNIVNEDNSKGFYGGLLNHRYSRGYSFTDNNNRYEGDGNMKSPTLVSTS